MNQPLSRIAYIDSLRALALTGVVATHAAKIWPGLPTGIGRLALLGTNGVHLFFVASALTLLLSWSRREGGAIAFYVRRLFRIAPMFWLAMATYLLLDWMLVKPFWLDGTVNLHTIILTSFFVHGWSPNSINAVVPGGWTIAVEMMFYLAFPLLATYVTSLTRATIFLIASLLIAIAANTLAGSVWQLGDNTRFTEFVYYWLPNSLPCFATGFVAFHLLKYAPRSRQASAGLLMGAALLALYVAWGSLPFVSTGAHPFSRGTVFSFACLLLILALHRVHYPVFVNKWVCFLGRVSYSGYLTHWIFVELALMAFRGVHAGPVLRSVFWVCSVVVLLALTALASSVTYRLVEKRGMRAGANVISAFEGETALEAEASSEW